MKQLIRRLLFFFLFVPLMSVAQGNIVSLFPNSGTPGQEVEVLVRGLGTDFREVYSLDMGAGITVKSLRAVNSEMLYADIRIEKTAVPASYDLQMKTGSGTLSFPSAFSVMEQGAQVFASLNLNAVQRISLNELSTQTPTTPIIFSVGLFNDQRIRTLTVVLEIVGKKFGELASFKKDINAQAGYTGQFTNRDFDLAFQSVRAGVVKKSMEIGSFPADDYTFYLTVYEGEDVLYSTEQEYEVLNPMKRPELISPGNDFSSSPLSNFSYQPLFQWYSLGDSYDFYLYKLEPGQNSAQEATINRPVYTATGLKSMNLLYPASAYPLRENEVYAWRVVAHFEEGSKNEELESEVFWFRVKTDSKPENTISQIILEPEEVSLAAGGKYHFTAKVLNQERKELNIKPHWRVLPSDGGSIDADGNFTAGTSDKPVAVIAELDGQQEYVLITIKPSKSK